MSALVIVTELLYCAVSGQKDMGGRRARTSRVSSKLRPSFPFDTDPSLFLFIPAEILLRFSAIRLLGEAVVRR